MDYVKRRWRGWRLKYTTLLVASLILFYFITQLPQVDSLIRELSSYGYLGAAIAGVFFVSAYTVAPAAFVLFELGNYMNPFEIAVFGGLGAMIGDYLIFRFVKDQLYEELKPHFRWFRWFRRRRQRRNLLLRMLMPTLGAIIIISPLPDEVGVGMLGVTRMNGLAFLILTYVLNAAGIFVLALIARAT